MGGKLFLGNHLILTRLLFPELFGLMALVNTFIQGLILFSDIGIKPSIIRSPRGDDPTFFNTAWTLQVIRGFGLWIGCCLIAWPVSQFYDNEQLVWLLPTVGLTTIISGFNSTSLPTLNRKLEIGKITVLDLGIQILALSIMIILAYFYRSIWALVVGSLVSVFIKMAISHRLEPTISNRFAWDKEALKEIISIGRWIFIATAMTFLAQQTDKIMLGKFTSLEILGVYTVAFTIANIPQQVLRKVSQQIMMPLVSQKLHLPRATLRAKIVGKRQLLLMLMAVMISVLFCTGDFIILQLYDSRYNDAAWILPILVLGLWPLILSVTMDKALYALGKTIYPAVANFCKFFYMLLLLPSVLINLGIIGGIVVIAFNDIPYYIAISYGLWQEKLIDITQDIQATSLMIGLIFLGTAVRYLLGLGISIDGIRAYL
ncbi:oligosaccharide flippase family protein [Crocosphaera watsonii WH 8501]|nr:oligosaccharide flippase family protein [Crocosphaera watsonii]